MNRTHIKKSISSLEDMEPALMTALKRSIPLRIEWVVNSIGGVTFEATDVRFSGTGLDLYRDDKDFSIACNLGALTSCTFKGDFEELADGLKLDLLISWPNGLARCNVSAERAPTSEEELRVQ